ncbi:MAG TPA: CPBP family intramembrane glutamic endopeptidase, partial [Candidatus Aquilonibacter sp.]|nr:CPBP family intramembrane glutamic endopeptidase [Candidatus Aquilonibacter sp.]
VALVAYVLVIEKLPLSSVGWRAPSLSSAGFGFLGAVVAFAGMAALYLYVIPHIDPAYGAKSTALTALPLALKVEIVLRAAIFEELFYRGFMIERLSSILRWRWLAAAISWAVFTAAHLSYWGWGSVLIAGFGGLVLTLLYLWRRDLSSNMIAHALTDGVALFL